ncbi:MAG: hypothetical protein WBD67_11845 [Terracidiphilus sp.]
MNDSFRISLSRREFLRATVGAAASSVISVRSYGARRSPVNPKQKVIVVTFGGGARDDETFSIDGQQYIPHLLNTLAPQCCFFTQVINRGILGHYVATASIATGAYETFDNFVAQPPVHPTIFEYFRRDLRRPLDDAWVIAPGNLFAQMGSSRSRRYGLDDGAEVIIPKRLLATVLGGTSGMQLDSYPYLLRDSYEAPAASDLPVTNGERERMEKMLVRMKLDRAQLRSEAAKFESPDALSLYMTKHVMRTFAPSLLFLTLHDMDIAHSGAYSLYLEGIRRTDRLCAELLNEVQQNPEYKDRTTVLILPDFGRDGDNDPGGNGFQHHRTGSPAARTTWMMALGFGVREKTIVHRPIESIDVAPTVASLFGLDAGLAQGKLIPELR